MKRIIIFAFTLLTTLSIVNAITSFVQCDSDPYPPMNLLTVTMSPDPLIPGEYSTFEVSGQLSKTTSNADFAVGFGDKNGKRVGDLFILDICKINTCPTNYISAEIGKINVPVVLPKPYTITVLVAERTASSGKEALGCAFASVF